MMDHLYTDILLLQERRRAWAAQGHVVVFTNGAFDIIHAGHVLYLQAARKLGDVLIVGLNSDASVRSYKGPARPIVPQQQRATVLKALRAVDHVVLFNTPTAIPLVEAIRPDIYVKGGDYAQPGLPNGKPLPEAPYVLAYGGRVELIAYREGLSTTALIEKIRQENTSS